MKDHYAVEESISKTAARIDGRRWSTVNIRTHGALLLCANCGHKFVTGTSCFAPMRPRKGEENLYVCRDCVGPPKASYTLEPLAPSHYSVYIQPEGWSPIRIGTVEKLAYNKWQAISASDGMAEGRRTREDCIDWLRGKWTGRKKR